MPVLEFAVSVPAGDVDVVHTAVVKGRALGVVTLEGHMAGGHVADANDSEVANFALRDELLDFLVIPGVAVKEIDGNDAVASLDFANEVPLGTHVGGDGLFGEDVFMRSESAADLLGTGIRESEKADNVDGRIGEDGFGGLINGGGGDFLGGKLAGVIANIVDGGDFPQVVFEHGGYKTTAHPAVAEDARPEFFAHGYVLRVSVGGTTHRDSGHMGNR